MKKYTGDGYNKTVPSVDVIQRHEPKAPSRVSETRFVTEARPAGTVFRSSRFFLIRFSLRHTAHRRRQVRETQITRPAAYNLTGNKIFSYKKAKRIVNR